MIFMHHYESVAYFNTGLCISSHRMRHQENSDFMKPYLTLPNPNQI